MPRALDDWWTPDGKKFSFPRHDAANDLYVGTRIVLDMCIRELLGRAVPPNLPEFQNLLESWRENLPHTYAWARPDRLWFVVPFADSDCVRDITVRCNGEDVILQWFAPRDRPNGSRIIAYADITDVMFYGSENLINLHLRDLQPNQFLGPFLDYPLGIPVTGWEVAREPQPARVVYEHPVDPEMPARVASIGNTAPRVLAVRIDPPFIKSLGKHTFMADINMPGEQLQKVWISIDSSGEAAMSWDNRRHKWTYEWTAPTRSTDILDTELAFVWAVSKDGILSESFPVAIRWMFA